MTTIAVIGAGLIGRLIALELNAQGYTVQLFDKDSKSAHGSTAWAAGGMISPLSEALKCEANMVTMGFDALTRWPNLLAKLELPVFFQQKGTIVLTHEQDKGDYLRFTQHLEQHYGQHTTQVLDRRSLTQLEPSLGAKFHQGLFLPDEAQLDNRQLLIALTHAIEHSSIEWLTDSLVTDIVATGSEQQQVCVGEQTFHADWVIDCRGIGAIDNSFEHQGLDAIRAVRGELFHLYAPEVELTRLVRLTHPRYQIYIAPKGDHRFVLGATEIESDSQRPMTVRSSMELLSAAYSVDSGFAEAQILEQVSHCRPALFDNQPKIQVKGRHIAVNGLFRHGFLLAPVVLEHVSQLMASKIEGKPTNYAFSELVEHIEPEYEYCN